MKNSREVAGVVVGVPQISAFDILEAKMQFLESATYWHDNDIENGLMLTCLPKIMGFADLSISEIAQDYNLPIEEVLRWCDELSIAYKSPQTRLALEDAKAILSKIHDNPQENAGSDCI
ncbi:hypothetical protein [Phormidium pseudopriestleyi]